MRPRLLRLYAIPAILLPLCAAMLVQAACSSMTYTHGVPNLQQVEPGVLRGGEPTHDGWVYLAEHGVKTVVKLNDEREASDAEARALGMEVVYVPLPPSTLASTFEEPEAGEVAEAIAVLQDSARWPIYVHCSHGQDRTGLVIALFRVLHDHWTKHAAESEMRADGFHRTLVGLERFWESFDGTLPPAPPLSVPPAMAASRSGPI